MRFMKYLFLPLTFPNSLLKINEDIGIKIMYCTCCEKPDMYLAIIFRLTLIVSSILYMPDMSKALLEVNEDMIKIIVGAVH